MGWAEGFGDLLMAFWHPTFVAGEMPQDLHSAGLLVGPHQLHCLLFAKRGWGQPWARATGVEGARSVRSS